MPYLNATQLLFDTTAIDIDINEDNDIEPFPMKQMMRPFLFVLCLDGMAIILFLAEIVIYKWKHWRDRE